MITNYIVPFFANTPDDTRCFQAGLKMLLKYFRPAEEYSWEELDTLAAKVRDQWTWPMAGLLWMQAHGFEVRDIEPFDYSKFVQDRENYLIALFGKEVAEEQIKHSDLNQAIESSKGFVEGIKPEMRIPAIQEIVGFLENGYLVCCNVNARTLNDEEGFVGHFVVIKGVGDDRLILHNPGSPPVENREVSFTDFEKAWGYPNEMAKNLMAFRSH